MYKVMTPGPTQVKENVRMARSLVCTNPDLDEDFVEFYKDTCELISSLLGTKNETLILDGEGILGLEAACASLTEPGDKVLIIENGVYGEGFADFVSMYGGVPEFYHADRLNAIDPDALSSYLKELHDYKIIIISENIKDIIQSECMGNTKACEPQTCYLLKLNIYTYLYN